MRKTGEVRIQEHLYCNYVITSKYILLIKEENYNESLRITHRTWKQYLKG